MWSTWWNPAHVATADEAARRIRERYACCRELIALNNESLELLAGLQEDLQFIPPRRDLLGPAIAGLFDRAGRIVGHLECLTGRPLASLHTALDAQRQEVERDMAARQELRRPRLAASLSEVGMADAADVGGKAAALGEIRRALGLPVPDGYALTAEAYLAFFGVPYGLAVRDAVRGISEVDGDRLEAASARLTALVDAAPLPRAVHVALVERGRALGDGRGLAVRFERRRRGRHAQLRRPVRQPDERRRRRPRRGVQGDDRQPVQRARARLPVHQRPR